MGFNHCLRNLTFKRNPILNPHSPLSLKQGRMEAQKGIFIITLILLFCLKKSIVDINAAVRGEVKGNALTAMSLKLGENQASEPRTIEITGAGMNNSSSPRLLSSPSYSIVCPSMHRYVNVTSINSSGLKRESLFL